MATGPGSPDSAPESSGQRNFDDRKRAALAQFNDVSGASTYPWYDSLWLGLYDRVFHFLQEKHPDKVVELESLVEGFRTSPDFAVSHLPELLDADQLHAVREEVERVTQEPISIYERDSFGRDLLHDRPFFTQLQHELADQVGEVVGEPVAPCYNFLSLYGSKGVCEPHLDTPQAKWTLDICIDQSVEWPLHVSPVVPWPREWKPPPDIDWQQHIRSTNTFTSHVLAPGGAIVFAGSSQWHYRDPMPATSTSDYCHLLFLHYVPATGDAKIEPSNWPALLGIPALSALCDRYYKSDELAKGLHSAL